MLRSPLSQMLKFKGFKDFEGNCSQIPEQIRDLVALSASHPSKPLRIMEIGFNAGHSAEVFLNNNCMHLVSFDLGQHMYVLEAKRYLDHKYPKRHLLVLGDSQISMPKFLADYPGITFDVIFIDGGHDYEIAKSDMENSLKMATDNTLIIMDDVVSGQQYQWTTGPSRVWHEMISERKIGYVSGREYAPGRGMVWGYKITQTCKEKEHPETPWWEGGRWVGGGPPPSFL